MQPAAVLHMECPPSAGSGGSVLSASVSSCQAECKARVQALVQVYERLAIVEKFSPAHTPCQLDNT